MNNDQPHVEVISTEIEAKEGKNGEYHTQSVMFQRGDGAAYPLDVFVDKGKPHAPGRYAISRKSFVPSRFGVDFKLVLGAPIAAGK